MEKNNFAYQNEAMILGSILQDETLLEEVTLQPKHFLFEKNRNMFKEMLKLRELDRDVSFITLTALPKRVIDSMGGMSHVADVMNSTPSVNSFPRYERVIKEHHAIESARNHAKEFLEQTKEVNDIKILDNYLQKTTKLETDTVTSDMSFKQMLKKRVQEHYDSPLEGLSGLDTGFKTTNRYTDGWQKGDLIIMAGRPSMGKTAFALNSLLKGCQQDSNLFATFFSVEMSEGSVIDRLIANTSNIGVQKMRNPNKTFQGNEWEDYSKTIGILETMNFDIRKERTVSDIRAATRKNMKEYPDKDHVIAIDYLTLLRSSNPSGSRTYEIEEIIIGLNDLAVDLDIPVIVVSQLSRGVESRDNKRPNMGDLRDSGAIEQAADVIIMLYRDEYYNEDTTDRGIVELLFVKNRQGSTGTVKMSFDKVTNNFSDLY
jgi:replicative DNA helicase